MSMLLFSSRDQRTRMACMARDNTLAVVVILTTLSILIQQLTQVEAVVTASSVASSSFHRQRLVPWGSVSTRTTVTSRITPSRLVEVIAADCNINNSNNAFDTARILRGGAKAKKPSVIQEDNESDAEEEEEEEQEEVEEEDEYDAEEDEYDDEEEEEAEQEEEEELPAAKSSAVQKKKSTLTTGKTKVAASAVAAAVVYDEPLVPSPFANLFCTFGVMMLARRVDLFHPTIVRIARFAFITYLLVLQLFVFYVRIQAKIRNDRTMIELTNPLSSVLRNQLGGVSDSDGGALIGGGAGAGMMKNLASSLLSSQSTIMEYDLKQALSMQSGLIFNMIFMWFLHFKMEQVQPLLVQTGTGFLNLVYSPLFQAYILKRNLQRPFQNPALPQPPAPAVEEQDAETSSSASPKQLSQEDYEEDDDSSSKKSKMPAKGSKQNDNDEEEEESDAEEVNDESENDDKKDSEAEVVLDEKVQGDVVGVEDVDVKNEDIKDQAETAENDDNDNAVNGVAATAAAEVAVDSVQPVEKNDDNDAAADTQAVALDSQSD